MKSIAFRRVGPVYRSKNAIMHQNRAFPCLTPVPQPRSPAAPQPLASAHAAKAKPVINLRAYQRPFELIIIEVYKLSTQDDRDRSSSSHLCEVFAADVHRTTKTTTTTTSNKQRVFVPPCALSAPEKGRVDAAGDAELHLHAGGHHEVRR